MAKELFVTKTHKVKDKVSGEVKVIENTYRVDAAFVPTSTSEIAPEFIENYCVAKGKIDWLVEEVQKTITDKNGKEKDLPFVSLRADFVKEFFPSIFEATPKKKSNTFKQMILAKYKK